MSSESRQQQGQKEQPVYGSGQKEQPVYDPVQHQNPGENSDPVQHQNPGEKSHVPYPKVFSTDEESSLGTPVMGTPAVPSAHPDNKQAAMRTRPELVEPDAAQGVDAAQANENTMADTVPVRESSHNRGSPYVQTSPIASAPTKSPMETVVESLNKWSKQAEVMAENVWNHLKTGPSMTDTAWGKLTQGAKIITEGGFENAFKQTFGAASDERLRKTYACYLSTSTGPVPGILYISTHKIAFCSDKPLTFTPASGQQAMSYYKVVIPVQNVRVVNSSSNPERPAEKYIQLVTNDNHEFWFMGFVNYDKASKNLQLAVNNRDVRSQSVD